MYLKFHKILKKKPKLWLLIVLNATFALASLIYFYSNKYFFVGSDIYYYLSLADNLIEKGVLLNITSIPPLPIASPQNGIVFIMFLLKKINFSDFQIIITIPFINFFLYLISFYAVYKLAKFLKLNKKHIYLLSIFYYAHWIIYRLQLIPVNDGIYNIAVFWLIYLITYQLDKKKKFLIPIILLSVLSINFRINTYLVLLSVAAVLFIQKRWKQLSTYMLIFFFTFFSLKLVVRSPIYNTDAKNLSEIHTYVSYYGQKTVNKIAQSPLVKSPILDDLHELFFESLPEVFLVRLDKISPSINIIYLIFLLIQISGFVYGIKKKNFLLIFLSTFIFANYSLGLLTGILSQRYFFHSYILTILIVLFFSSQNRKLEIIIYPYLFCVLFSSINIFAHPRQPTCVSELLYKLREENFTLPENSILLSDTHRHPYFFSDKSTHNPGHLSIKEIEGEQIFVIGESESNNDVLQRFSKKTKIQDYTITPIRTNITATGTCSLSELKINGN